MGAMKAADNDCAIAIEEQIEADKDAEDILHSMFLNLDSDGSGSISKGEFSEHMNNPQIRAHLRTMGIDCRDPRNMFELLDDDHSGLLEVSEVVKGLMQLRGSAKAVDMLTLLAMTKRVHKELRRMHGNTAAGSAADSSFSM